MTKFVSKRMFSLDFLGDQWKDSFIFFSALSIKESRELMNKKLTTREPGEIIEITLKLLQDHFISGVAYSEGTKELVKLKAGEIEELPQDILEKAVLFLVGGSISTKD